MKKYYILIIIIINLFAAYYWLIREPKQHEYSETVVLEISNSIDEELIKLFGNIDQQLNAIQKDLNKPSLTKETCDKYFIDLLENQNIFYSFYFAKNNKQYIIHRDGKSLVSASDSTKEIDIVKWTRFEKQKKISEWDELFDKKDFNFDWTDQLYKKTNTYNWIKHYSSLEKGNIALLGKSWKDEDNSYLLVVRFLKEEIKPVFKSLNKFDSYKILLKTKEGELLNIISKNKEENDTIISKVDFIKVLNSGLLQVNNDKIFSFSYNGEMHWASIKNLNSILAIKDIIVSIPERSIIKSQNKKDNLGLLYYGLVAFISALVLLIIYKRSINIPKFRFGKRKEISISTILQNNENRHLEFKSSLRWDYRQDKVNTDLELVILKTIAAFGNSDGGVLLIGVDDDKNILGLENDFNSLKKKDADFYEIYMRNLFHKYFGVKYTTENIRMDFINDAQKVVCLVEVFKAEEPLFLKAKDKNGSTTEKFYVRSGNSSQQIDSLKDINDYIFDRFKKD